MKILFLSLCFFMGNLFLNSVKAQEFINYQVKVVSDSLPTLKGTLEKVSPEGIAVNDGYGNYIMLRSKNIISIRLKKKGITTGKGFLVGTLAGAAIGSLAFTDNNSSGNEQLVVFLAATTLGAAVGTTYGLLAELKAKKLFLEINKDEKLFASEYKKLEIYSKANYIDKP
ncbi:hypothetical protein [Pedobacter miscanthi]|jgi:hypothetical protein|uniref:hypothetical protein n=1 Tax=Pedobacter miscanthi TaxID=2259170 RepID=UPI002931B1DD|nr:hypothetical protein [Pedobacter miscanthi]